ncbi:sensor histidine kinase [Fangia hongkongensis]|uniref:sensor histidine kinase n=3 Tax=Fangia hongkongensis TaxID=270495 RepID=UPI00035D4EB0|nr:HAMP domain-containing sensor histidine kinase [Fangia hongkongensis]
MKVRFLIIALLVVTIGFLIIHTYFKITQAIQFNNQHQAIGTIMDIVNYGKEAKDNNFKSITAPKHYAYLDLDNFYFDLDLSPAPIYTPTLFMHNSTQLQNYLNQHPFVHGNFSLNIKPHLWLNIQARPNYSYLFINLSARVITTLFISILLFVAGLIFHRLYSTLTNLYAILEELRIPKPASIALEIFQGTTNLIHLLKSRVSDLMNTRVKILESVSHDLNTPLTRVYYRLHSLDQTKEVKACLKDIDETRLMIKQILDMSTFESQPHKAIELNSLTNIIIEEYISSGVNISHNLEHEHNIIMGSAIIIKRILYNLINNSIKFATQIDIALFRQQNNIVLRVSDNGPGIPKSLNKSLLFQAKYQADNQHEARIRAGHGLGLAVVYELVHQINGEIIIENKAPKGLTISIFLEPAKH